MGTRRLTLLRHGQAQSPDAYAEDFERPLTRRGEIEAAEMAKRLVFRGLVPELIVASPAERAWSTAKIVARSGEMEQQSLRCARELYTAAAGGIWQLIRELDPAVGHVLICAHNPALSDLASRFGPRPQRRRLRTAGFATAVWHHADWQFLEPEAAASLELDDPDSLAQLWS